MAFQLGGRFHVVEIKSFAVIDGQADAGKVGGGRGPGGGLRPGAAHAAGRLGHDRARLPRGGAGLPGELRQPARRGDGRRAQAARGAQAAAGPDRPGSTACWTGCRRISPSTWPPTRTACRPGRRPSWPSALRQRRRPLRARLPVHLRHVHVLPRRGPAGGSTDLLGRSVRDELGGVARVAEALGLAEGTLRARRRPGGDRPPAPPGGPPARGVPDMNPPHRANLQRLRDFPHTLLATATHDHKRGEDVRARLAVLSELPQAIGARIGAQVGG